MDTLKTLRRVILRVFHERDINWVHGTGVTSLFMRTDRSIPGSCCQKESETNGRDDDKDTCCLAAYLVQIYEIGSIRLSHPHCSPCPMSTYHVLLPLYYSDKVKLSVPTDFIRLWP